MRTNHLFRLVDLQATSNDARLACMHCHKVHTGAISPTGMIPDHLRTGYKCEDHCYAATRINSEAAGIDAKHACKAANCMQADIQV